MDQLAYQMSTMDPITVVGPWMAQEFEFKTVAIVLHPLNSQSILALDYSLADLKCYKKNGK